LTKGTELGTSGERNACARVHPGFDPGSGPGSGERESCKTLKGVDRSLASGNSASRRSIYPSILLTAPSKEYGDYYAREFTFSCSSPDSFLSSRPQRMQERYASGIASTGSGLPCNTTCGCSGERAGDRCGPGGWIRNRSSGGARCPEGCEPEAGRSSLT